jgi:hypothetical protein
MMRSNACVHMDAGILNMGTGGRRHSGGVTSRKTSENERPKVD